MEKIQRRKGFQDLSLVLLDRLDDFRGARDAPYTVNRRL